MNYILLIKLIITLYPPTLPNDQSQNEQFINSEDQINSPIGHMTLIALHQVSSDLDFH